MTNADRITILADWVEADKTMTLTLQGTRTTDPNTIAAAIPYEDMRHAVDAAIRHHDEHDEAVLFEVHRIDGLDVVWFPIAREAMVNEWSNRAGESLPVFFAETPEDAAREWSAA